MTKDLVYTSGTVPSVNGTIPEGIEAQTVSSVPWRLSQRFPYYILCCLLCTVRPLNTQTLAEACLTYASCIFRPWS